MMTEQRRGKGQVTFVCNPASGVRKVYLAGDFNNWDPQIKRMTKVFPYGL